MDLRDALRIIEEDFVEALRLAREYFLHNFDSTVFFYAPGFIHYEVEGFKNTPLSFPALSITGEHCSLRCSHCNAVILKSMIPTLTSKELFEECVKVKEHGGLGVLISGGSNPRGKVPLEGFLETIAKIKRELGLMVVVHTGLVDEELARGLAEAGVDAALLDVVGCDDTIKEVLHLNAYVTDFERSLKLLSDYGVPAVPHIVVGLHYGELRGEFEALRLIARYRPAAAVIVALTPLPGTEMESVAPPSPREVVKVLVAARLTMPNTPLALGCARPRGPHKSETDRLAIKAGVNAIAFPAEEAIAEATSLGLKYCFVQTCCSRVHIDATSRALDLSISTKDNAV
ncbi:MAG: radical SAM protein [Thermoprotei archaeon]|nr:MAG: radical SAM protein [Thermoprotei archaeon]